MTSRERLLTAMRLDGPGELPIQVRGVRSWDDAWVASRDPSYKPVIEVVAQHGDYVDGWGPSHGYFLSMAPVESSSEQVEHEDWIETITTLHAPGGDLRTRDLSSKRGLPGMQMEFPVKTLEDVRAFLSIPYVPLGEVDPAPYLAKDREMGERGLVLTYFGQDPIGNVHDIMGSELLAIWSIDERDTILMLIDVFLERLLDRIEALIAAGIGPIYSTLGQEYATPPLHSAADFRRFCVEPERQILQRLHEAGLLLHVHSHGPLDAVLEDFRDIADILHPIEAPPLGNVELADAKRRIGDTICLEGNIQIGDVYATPTAKLVEMVKRAIDDAAEGGGFVLCPTASPHTTVLTDLTVRNYVAMVETAVEYGR